MKQYKDNRLVYIDVIRGLAIFIMIAANSAPYVMNEPYPYLFRVFSSYAAPIFIALSGYMLGLNSNKQKTTKLLYRGSLIILVAACIDIFIWDLMPFISYDVLYQIGICIILYPLILLLNRTQTIVVIVMVFIISFLSQFIFDYQLRETDIALEWKNFKLIFHQFSFLFLDGWFPIFPWMGVFLLGHFAGKFTILLKHKQKQLAFGVMAVVLVLSVFVLFIQNRAIREGYSELFYPADFFYCISAFCVLAIFAISYKLFNRKLWVPLIWLGRSSLFFYIFLLVIISFYIKKIHLLFGEYLFVTFILFYAFVFFFDYLLYKLKQTSVWRKFPYLLRFV